VAANEQVSPLTQGLTL